MSHFGPLSPSRRRTNEHIYSRLNKQYLRYGVILNIPGKLIGLCDCESFFSHTFFFFLAAKSLGAYYVGAGY